MRRMSQLKGLLRPSSHATVVAYLALFVSLGGGAFAAGSFVGANGQIYGCVSKHGQLSLVKAGARCHKGKHQIVWNEQGPKGDTGQRGAPGPGAIMINWAPPGAAPQSTVASVGPWAVALSCDVSGPYDIRPHAQLWIKGPGSVDRSVVSNFDDSSPQLATASATLSTTTFTSVGDTMLPEGGHYERVIGDWYLGTANSVALLHVNVIADNRTQALCRAEGAVLPTT